MTETILSLIRQILILIAFIYTMWVVSLIIRFKIMDIQERRYRREQYIKNRKKTATKNHTK